MGKQFSFTLRAELSSIVGDNKIIGTGIGPDGQAVLLMVVPEFEKTPFSREGPEGGASFPDSRAKSCYPAIYIRFDGHKEIQRTELAQVEIAFPHVQPLPNGEILLVGARCYFRDGDPEKNAMVYSREGKLLRQFVLGDGINDVQTTSDGKIWVSYFDEGVFGNFGWKEPLGASGLICFDANGVVEWKFTPPEGFDFICDCYALNVAKDAVWACYYTDFPLVRIDAIRQVRGWNNNVGGANALVTDGKKVLLWGGYGDKAMRCVVQSMSENTLAKKYEVTLCLPDGSGLVGTTVFGRDLTLHAFVADRWFSLDLNQLP